MSTEKKPKLYVTNVNGIAMVPRAFDNAQEISDWLSEQEVVASPSIDKEHDIFTLSVTLARPWS